MNAPHDKTPAQGAPIADTAALIKPPAPPAHRWPKFLPAILAGVLSLALLAVIGTTLWSSRNNRIENAATVSRNLALVIEEQTRHSLQSLDANLDAIGTLWQHGLVDRRLNGKQLHDILRQKASLNKDLRSIFILDTHGVMIYHSGMFPAEPMNFSDRDYFQVPAKGEPGMYISKPMKGRITGRWGLVVSRRLVDQQGKFSGVVAAALEPDQLREAYARLEFGKEGLINLRHTDGDLIIRVPHLESAIGQKIASTPAMLEAVRRAQGPATIEIRSAFDGKVRISSAHMVPNTPLLIFVGMSKDEVLAPWYREVAAYSLAAVLLMAIIVWLQRLLVRELRRREALLASLAESEALLREHRDHLQELVDARTHDLVAARDAAEGANRMKSEFLANISHELRTPMHAILSFAKLGLDKIGESNPSAGKLPLYLQRITQSGERLLRLVNDLLDLSKLEAGKMEYLMGSCDLGAIATDVAAELSEMAASKQVHVRVESLSASRRAWCDAVRMTQVVRNLLSNAIKFTPPGSTVRIELRDSVLQWARARDDTGSRPALSIAVADQGPGIPGTELEAVFDKFTQGSNTKTGAGGTGLGLSICREIVLHHGGRIWATNNRDVGATLHVLLPADPPLMNVGQRSTEHA